MRNLFLILVCTVIIGGCGSMLKNSWLNFRAYYNTYYNAQENFNAGLKKVKEQPVTIDPIEPVRIHPTPVQAGNSDFQKAIDKGARILRKFSGSHWADDALLLIGKSYYYRQEFYAALQKFEELRNASTSPKMEQLSIIWKGRTLLDLKQYEDGAAFLESELNLYPNNWSKVHKAEIQVLAGENYALLENWEQSAQFLSAAVSHLKNKELLGRTLFLYGQVLERLGRYGEANFAFSKVAENFPGFEYIFWARYKQADVARKNGNLDQAKAIYENLRKDDKNFKRRNELTFEIARTLEMQGEVEKAEEDYKGLLYGEQQVQQRRSVKADIYYRLGRIYSDYYNDYPVAAAYFDSSSSISEAPQKVEATQDAESLADTYGKYTRLQNTISRADSLIWLGSLSETRLDSVLQRIRIQKQRDLLKERKTESQNVFANRTVANSDEQSSAGARYGFLNHQNLRLVEQSKAEFRIIWGNRPLIDNWRRLEVVRQSNVSRRSRQQADDQELPEEAGVLTVDMNLDEIPRTHQEMNQLEVEKVKAQYELGNLLFLNLNKPDSARYYFHKVIKNKTSEDLRPRAMYSLHELFKTSDNRDSLQYWRQKILQEYPNSRYALRLQDQEVRVGTDTDSTKMLVQKFQTIVNSKEKHKAAKLRKLALENRSSELAPYIHYQSIESYIEEAKAHTGVIDSVKATVKISQDSMSPADSMQVAPTIKSQIYGGAYWDSVRLAVQEFDTAFPNAKQQKKVAKLRELLKEPEASSQIPTCESLGISLAVKPSMDQFLSTIVYPEKLQGASITGEVEYSFVVTSSGEMESYELISQRTSLGIEEAFEKAFDETLQFEGLQMEDPPEKVRCHLSFPIQH